MKTYAPRLGFGFLPVLIFAVSCSSSSHHAPGGVGDSCSEADDCEDGLFCSVDGECYDPGGGDGDADGDTDTDVDSDSDSDVDSDSDSDSDGGGCVDEDDDGFYAVTTDCPTGDDCDDGDGTSNPDATETCGDGADNDCDGEVDEAECSCVPGTTRECFTGEAENRGRGACHDGAQRCLPDGTYGECVGDQLPAAMDDCGNAVDDDCDGSIDEDCDCDPGCLCEEVGASEICECSPPTNQPCYSGPVSTGSLGLCHGGTRDCVDDGSGVYRWSACEGEVLPTDEICDDDLDQDCDGEADDGCGELPDDDEDGYSVFDGDCDDNDAARHPGAEELCNGIDDNCNGAVDETCDCTPGQTQPCYTGPTGTAGVGDCLSGSQSCEGGSEFAQWSECEGEVGPGVEVCDEVDNDCDGEVDERWAIGSNGCGYCTYEETVCDGADDDCDGLVDEGLVNACGLCPPEPCFEDGWSVEAEWDQGTYDGTSTSPSEPLHPDCTDVDTICLDASAANLGHIWIANANDNEVVRMNVDTGVVELELPSLGHTPSRTAVDTRDGSVWVANRAYTTDWSNGEYSNVVHFASDGTLICRLPLPGMVRALAIDADYDIWAGLWGNQEIVHIDGETCTEIGRQNVGCSPYGATVDSYGNVWFACNSNWGNSLDPTVQSLLRVDVTDITSFTRHVPPADFGCFNLYGLAVDSLGRPWVGSYACGSIYRYDPTGDLWARVDPGGSMRGVAVAADGYVYVADSSANRRVIRIEPETMAWEAIALGAVVTDTVGAAVDLAGRIWVVSRGTDNASRIDVSGWPGYAVEHFHTNGDDPYTYSDMTGVQHLLHTSPTGTWSVTFDSGYADATWSTVEWDAHEPAGTDVTVRARTAPTEADLAAASWSAVYTDSPAEVTADATMANPNRWIEVEVTLSTTDTSTTPVLYGLQVFWEY